MKFAAGKRSLALLLTVTLLLTLSACADAERRPSVGVAWRNNQESESFVAACQAIEAAGGKPVLLPQVLSADLAYDAEGVLINAANADGSLSDAAAKLVRCNTWQGSNAPSIMEGISAVVFPGGEDISPSLYYEPQPVQTQEGFSAERDVSDYLLMSYCMKMPA